MLGSGSSPGRGREPAAPRGGRIHRGAISTVTDREPAEGYRSRHRDSVAPTTVRSATAARQDALAASTWVGRTVRPTGIPGHRYGRGHGAAPPRASLPLGPPDRSDPDSVLRDPPCGGPRSRGRQPAPWTWSRLLSLIDKDRPRSGTSGQRVTPVSVGSGDDSDFGCVAAGLELGVAGVQRCGQCLGHSDVGRVVGGELMAVPPDSLSERLKAMAGASTWPSSRPRRTDRTSTSRR